jgi:glycosyltransferase involved in cell wall biosynthesis
MRILWLDPFHGGSHRAVSTGFARHSQHDVTLLTLPIAGGWRWRMRGAAITLARMLRERSNSRHFDLIVATDMLDLATFLALTRDQTATTAVALYMHENQLTYPIPEGRQRDLTFPWINYTAALVADALLFNSAFHRDAFVQALPSLIGRFHDHHELDLIATIAGRSQVLYPGLDLRRFTKAEQTDPLEVPAAPAPPVILWNSRWEYDKAPAVFFDGLRVLEQRGVDVRVIVAGEHVDPDEPSFAAARDWLAPRALWWGYAPDFASYRALLHQADIVVSTAIQEFFGIAVLEAIFCGCVPALPNRLAYPELLPQHLHELCLYGSPNELPDALERIIARLPSLRRADFSAIAERFDWKHAGPVFDAALERIAAQPRASHLRQQPTSLPCSMAARAAVSNSPRFFSWHVFCCHGALQCRRRVRPQRRSRLLRLAVRRSDSIPISPRAIPIPTAWMCLPRSSPMRRSAGRARTFTGIVFSQHPTPGTGPIQTMPFVRLCNVAFRFSA